MVDADLYLVIGLVLFALVLPTLLSALADGRAPRVAMMMVLISGTLIVVAVSRKPGGYAWAEVPQAFASVAGRLLH